MPKVDKRGEKMKGLKKAFYLIGVVTALFLACAFPVQAKKMTTAPKYSLTSVLKAPEITGKWNANQKRFKQDGTTYVKNKWVNIEGKIYYFNAKGRLVTGWIKYRGKQYYVKAGAGLQTSSWIKESKSRYYVDQNGIMVTGKRLIDQKYYYFRTSDGLMQTGWVTIGKGKYFFSRTTGVMHKERWVRWNGKYYYLMSNGRMARSRWLNLGGKKFYVNASGVRVTGTQYIKTNGTYKGYYFDTNGVYDPTVKVKAEVDPTKKMVALTFDDGPGRYTSRLLNVLQKNGAKATFFMVGQNVSSYKNTVKRMANMGCELGNHSWDHSRLGIMSISGITQQVSRTNQAIKNASGKYPTVFRLPYGDGYNNSTVLNALGLPSIYWSIDTMDWANTGNSQHTVNEVLNNVKSGDIVLMHDIHYATVVAAEKIIPALKSRGFQMVTVSQLATYKGKTTLRAGKTYFHFR